MASRQKHMAEEVVSMEMNDAALRITERGREEQNVEDADTSTHRWIFADAQLQSSRSARTPVDTESVIIKTAATPSSNRNAMSEPESPVKSVVDFRLLDRKVKRVHVKGKFPGVIRRPVRDVEGLRRGKGMVLYEIRSDMEEGVRGEDWLWSRTFSALPSKGKILIELEVMEEIIDKTC